MKHPIKSDKRWTITREFTGKPTAQFVIRFCDEWVDSRSTLGAAVVRAVGAHNVRNGALVVEEKR